MAQTQDIGTLNSQLESMQKELEHLKADKQVKEETAKTHWKSAAAALKNMQLLQEELDNTKVISSNMLIRWVIFRIGWQ